MSSWKDQYLSPRMRRQINRMAIRVSEKKAQIYVTMRVSQSLFGEGMFVPPLNRHDLTKAQKSWWESAENSLRLVEDVDNDAHQPRPPPSSSVVVGLYMTPFNMGSLLCGTIVNPGFSLRFHRCINSICIDIPLSAPPLLAIRNPAFSFAY